MIKETVNIQKLLNSIARNDQDAFRAFYDCFYMQVYRVASYYVKSKKIREEITSDVFVTIWENRKKNTEIENVEAYLYTITKNKALAYINNENKLSFTKIESIPQNYHSHTVTPEHIMLDEELSVIINDAINGLPERCRIIFLMAREDGLKYKEIAEALSISEKTVNAQMVIAIKKLTNILSRFILFFIL